MAEEQAKIVQFIEYAQKNKNFFKNRVPFSALWYIRDVEPVLQTLQSVPRDSHYTISRKQRQGFTCRCFPLVKEKASVYTEALIYADKIRGYRGPA